MMSSSPANPSPDADNAGDIKKEESAAQRQRQPSLLDGLLVPPSSSSTSGAKNFGILCNDPSGLCLSATGSFLNKEKQAQTLANVDDAVHSGVFTSLTKLAQHLHPGPTDASAAPLITIEYDDSNLLIKEYDGHAIALKVPAMTVANDGGATISSAPTDATTNGSS